MQRDRFSVEQLHRSHLLVVGSGFYGLTIAEQAAADGKRVTVIDRREHLGGNAWSSPDPTTGIEVHQYGSHIFHTSNETVWDYVNRFADFNDYRHHVWTVHAGRVYPMPISLATMTQFFGEHMTPQRALEVVSAHTLGVPEHPTNLEEKAISLIGRPLYEAFIKSYTAKQWQTDPKDLPAGVITRLPMRFTFDTRYFADTWEGIPRQGYGQLLTNLADQAGVSVYLGVDWFDIRHLVPPDLPVVYTGPLDRFFDYRAGRLAWRTLDLKLELLEVPDFQGTSVVNYADADVAHTRIHEFRHFDPDRPTLEGHTVIMTEYSRWAGREDEPYYPVNSREDRSVLSAYRQLAAREPSVIFGGRLGSYQYIDMHAAIASALMTYRTRVRPALERQGDGMAAPRARGSRTLGPSSIG
jgi:UDP-galactopyranose mutase